MATVFIPALLQRLTGGAGRVRVPGATLGQVLDNLDADYPGLRAELLDEGSRLPPRFVVAIDGETGHWGLIEPLHENAEVIFVPAISGGATRTQ